MGGLTWVVAAAVGTAWGLLADRVAARWPAKPDQAVRAVDWRTGAVAIAGGLAGGVLVLRFGDQPAAATLLGLYVAALVVLFATDLDQRLLPDELTLPLIALAIGAFALGVGPFVRTPGDLAWAAVAAIAVPLGLFLLAIPFGAGAIGLGDLKLLVSVGLLAGPARLFYGLIVGAVLAGLAVLVLLAVGRVSLRSFVPYGPFLIAGALWAILGLNGG
jgi:leader peptidase (prepilin peptidase) / N-methyltransferase